MCIILAAKITLVLSHLLRRHLILVKSMSASGFFAAWMNHVVKTSSANWDLLDKALLGLYNWLIKIMVCKISHIQWYRFLTLVLYHIVSRKKGASTDNITSQDTSNIDAERREKGCVGLVLKSRGANGDRIVGIDYDMMLEPQLLKTLYTIGTTGATQKVK